MFSLHADFLPTQSWQYNEFLQDRRFFLSILRRATIGRVKDAGYDATVGEKSKTGI